MYVVRRNYIDNYHATWLCVYVYVHVSRMLCVLVKPHHETIVGSVYIFFELNKAKVKLRPSVNIYITYMT